jgi:hypothetical protein
MGVLPRLIGTSGTRFILTAHMGKNNEMSKGPFHVVEKKISYLSSDKKVRGVPTEFFELPQVVYEAKNGRKFMNQSTKQAEFPREEGSLGIDLHIVKMVVLRNKAGLTGMEFPIIMSQGEGYQQELSDLMFLKEKYPGNPENYGIEGHNRSYYPTFYPDVKLSRPQFRKLCDKDPKIGRALQLLADLRQLYVFREDIVGELNLPILSPEEVYKKVTDNGFSWDEILETRPWYTMDNYNPKLPNYLSIIDLVLMATGKAPYWHKQ